MLIRSICPQDHRQIADIIRKNLELFHLDLPGTVYFDSIIDHLSEDYIGYPGRFYYILEDEGQVIGGVGLSELPLIEDCCELQKLYLREDYKGKGLGKYLVDSIEKKAKELGYKKMYLETHTNLYPAIHLYKKCGYTQIDRPDFVNHDTMDTFYIKEI